MKRWKRLALALLALAALTQIPFAYRRYQLGRLRERIDRLNATRAPADDRDPYADYAGVVHAHSALSHDSEGTPEEIARAARASGLAFVVMTEHPSEHAGQAALSGAREGVLFVAGGETVTAEGQRLLVVPGRQARGAAPPAEEAVRLAKAEGRLVFAAYPEEWRDLGLRGLDGVEVYNLYANTKRINYVRLFFDALWSYSSHPDLLFATFYERPDENLRRWDEQTRGRALVALAGNDAHQNVGFDLRLPSGRTLMRIRLDPYERSFRVVRTHVLVEKERPLDEAALVNALARGHCYLSFDLFGDATGFRFTAHADAETRIMGDEIKAGGNVTLRARTPVRARVVFFRDGQQVGEARDVTEAALGAGGRGVYRVEVYLDQLGDRLAVRPWIISNPIYVR